MRLNEERDERRELYEPEYALLSQRIDPGCFPPLSHDCFSFASCYQQPKRRIDSSSSSSTSSSAY